MEDTPDKVRRNLVTLSALIIAICFVDPAIKDQVSLFGVAHFEKISPTKLWLCVSVVLFYMGLRYRFDEKTSLQLKAMQEEYTEFCLVRLRRMLCKEAAVHFMSGRKPKLMLELRPYADDLRKSVNAAPDNQIKSTEVQAQEVPEKQTMHKGQVGLSVQVKFENGQTLERTGGSNIEYRVPALTRLSIRMMALLRMVAYSKSGVDVLAPIVVGCAAMSLCIWKLIALNGRFLNALSESMMHLVT